MAKTLIAGVNTMLIRYLHRFDKTENGKSEMRKAPIMLAILSVAFLQTLANANERAPLSADAREAFARGATIEIDLRVVDSTGSPVEGATVNVGLSQKESGKFKSHSGETDTNGNWRVEANCSNLIHIRVMKEGYYETRIKRHLFSVDHADVNRRINGRRWSPWEQIVVLKEKRKSVPLIAKGGKHHIPISETPVGFDFSRGEIIAPLEVGRAADILFQYSFQTTNNTGHCSLTLSAANPDDGMIILRTDEWSALKTVYEAPVDGYLSSISFERDWAGRTFSKREELDAEAYIVFRCRTKRDEEGKLITAHYGIIHGPLDFGQYGKDDKEGVMIFRSTFNPTPNDRNLEWNGSEL